MFRFESHPWMQAVLGQEGLPGKLAHVSIATSAHDSEYLAFDGALF